MQGMGGGRGRWSRMSRRDLVTLSLQYRMVTCLTYGDNVKERGGRVGKGVGGAKCLKDLNIYLNSYGGS